MPSFLTTHRALYLQLTRRAIAERYRGSMLGVLWSLLTPLLLLAVYGFVFIYVLNIRWGTSPDATDAPRAQAALMLFAGLLLHGFLAECLQTSATLIHHHTQYVKKVVFPLEILVPVRVTSALFQLGIGLLVLLAATAFLTGNLSATVLWLPVILLPFILLTIGLCQLIAALAVYVRDIAHFMGLLVTLLLFISTILIPAERLPGSVRPLIYLNPLSGVTDAVRQTVLTGAPPAFAPLAICALAACCVFWLGWSVFARLKRGFADVL